MADHNADHESFVVELWAVADALQAAVLDGATALLSTRPSGVDDLTLAGAAANTADALQQVVHRHGWDAARLNLAALAVFPSLTHGGRADVNGDMLRLWTHLRNAAALLLHVTDPAAADLLVDPPDVRLGDIADLSPSLVNQQLRAATEALVERGTWAG